MKTTLEVVLDGIRNRAEDNKAAFEQRYKAGNRYKIPGSPNFTSKQNAMNHFNAILSAHAPADQTMTPEQREIAQTYQPTYNKGASFREGGAKLSGLAAATLAGLITAFSYQYIAPSAHDNQVRIEQAQEARLHPSIRRSPEEVKRYADERLDSGRSAVSYPLGIGAGLSLLGLALWYLKKK